MGDCVHHRQKKSRFFGSSLLFLHTLLHTLLLICSHAQSVSSPWSEWNFPLCFMWAIQSFICNVKVRYYDSPKPDKSVYYICVYNAQCRSFVKWNSWDFFSTCISKTIEVNTLLDSCQVLSLIMTNTKLSSDAQ